MILSLMDLVESCPVLGDFGGLFYNVFAYFYGIPNNLKLVYSSS